MAKANQIEPTAEPDIELILTRKEADALMAVIYRVGGDPDTTPRGQLNAVLKAMAGAGIPAPKNYDNVTGTLWFK